MPQRSRNQELEAESRAHFELLLTKLGWVFEAFHNDYGLDGRVEVFQNGEATGVTFFVQLKATDEISLRKALKYSFKVEHIRYWLEQRAPVFVVRYLAVSQTFYISAIQYLFSPEHRDTQKKSLTLVFDDSARVSDPNELTVRFMRIYDLLYRPDLSVPVRLGRNLDLDQRTAQKMRSDFHTLVGESTLLQSASVGDALVAELRDRSVFLHWPQVFRYSFTVELSALQGSLENLAAWVLSQIAFLFLQYRRIHACKDILLSTLPYLRYFCNDRNYSLLLNEAVQASDAFNDAIRTAKECLAYRNISGARAAIGACLVHLPLTNRIGQHEIRELIEQVRNLSADEDPEVLANILFSVATINRVCERYTEALSDLELAATLFPEYRDRYHWHLERGKLLLHTHRYEESAAEYTIAFDKAVVVREVKAQAPQALHFAADAYVAGGMYQKALESMDRAFALPSNVNETMRMQYAFCSYISQRLFSAQEKQEFVLDPGLVDRLFEERNYTALQQLAEQALAADASHGQGWYLLSRVQFDTQQPGHGFQPACFAVLRAPYELDLTIHLIQTLYAHVSEMDDLSFVVFTWTLAIAYRSHRAAIRTKMEEVFMEPPEAVLSLLDLLDIGWTRRKYRISTASTPWGYQVIPWSEPPLLF